MRLGLMTRKRIAQEVAKRYRKVGKKAKSRMLDEFCILTGYSRSCAAWALRQRPPRTERARGCPQGRLPLAAAISRSRPPR